MFTASFEIASFVKRFGTLLSQTGISLSRASGRRQICECKFDDWLGSRSHAVIRGHELKAQMLSRRTAPTTH